MQRRESVSRLDGSAESPLLFDSSCQNMSDGNISFREVSYLNFIIVKL